MKHFFFLILFIIGLMGSGCSSEKNVKLVEKTDKFSVKGKENLDLLKISGLFSMEFPEDEFTVYFNEYEEEGHYTTASGSCKIELAVNYKGSRDIRYSSADGKSYLGVFDVLECIEYWYYDLEHGAWYAEFRTSEGIKVKAMIDSLTYVHFNFYTDKDDYVDQSVTLYYDDTYVVWE
jgi:hypothetical protein